MIGELNFARTFARTCVVVRVCRLSVDHRNFMRIDVDEFFTCRTEYRILKYEHVKKNTFK